MSMMDPDDEPDQPGIPDHVRQEADALLERWRNGEMDDKTRLLGLYVDDDPQIAMVPSPHGGPPRIGLAVSFTIGQVAFSDRVQFPEQEDVNKEFRKMEVTIKDDQFLDERARIQKGLAEGKTIEEIMLEGMDDDSPT